MKIIEYYNINFDSDEYMHDKSYCEKMIKYVDDNLLQKFNKEKHRRFEMELTNEIDEDEIQAMLDAENVEEQEEDDSNDENNNINDEEQIDDEDDANGNVTEEPEGNNQTEYDRMLKYLMIILYYNLDINTNKFVTDESYREEKIKEESFKEHLKKFDDEEKNVEIEGHAYIDNKLQIKFKGDLSSKGNDDNIVIKNSIATAAEEIPVVVNDNELKVTESKLR
jgi:hypothetical protein